MWTSTIPVITTRHISKATRDMLHRYAAKESIPKDGVTNVAEYEWGFFIRFCEETPVDSPDLAAIRSWLGSAGYFDNWVRLDADGDEVAGLPRHNW